MNAPKVMLWVLMLLGVEAKPLKRRSACPARLTRTSIVQFTVTRGPSSSTETASESRPDIFSTIGGSSSTVDFPSTAQTSSNSSQPISTLISIVVPPSTSASRTTSSIDSPIESLLISMDSSIPAVTSGILSKTSSIIAETFSAEPSRTNLPSSDPGATTFPRAYPADMVDELRDESLKKLQEFLGGRPGKNGCTLETVAIRREWSDLSVQEREDYTKSVRCLQSKPAKTPTSLASGAKSRFDDFVIAHIQQTPTVHNTANFLSWHRYFVWAYETALREECGYKGFHPYWNWDRYAADPENSPLFNGDAASIGGNSVNGGCVTTGPFKNMSVNVGPGNSLRHNPRCLKRNISPIQAARTTADKTLALITGSRDIGSFQDRLQVADGIHASGHFTIGGDPGGDIYASPGDPAFYLHHAMVDRVWWIWQLQDLESRLEAVAGRVGVFGGSGRVGTLTDDVNLGLVGDGVPLGGLLDTMGGKGGDLCYIYM